MIKVGSIVTFRGAVYMAICHGDKPGTFDLHRHPDRMAGDSWRDVPASELQLAGIATTTHAGDLGPSDFMALGERATQQGVL